MKKNGFTLIELMIVIAIIALLAAVALPKFANVTDDAKVANVRSNLSVLRTTVNMCYAKYGSYPALANSGTNNNYISTTGDVGTGTQQYYSKPQVEQTPAIGSTNPSRAVTNTTGSATIVGGWTYTTSNGEVHANLGSNTLNVDWTVE